jgi:hypothetical protein
MLVPDAGNRSAAGSVENAAAILRNQPHAIAANGYRGCFA